MTPRLPRARYTACSAEQRKSAMKRIVERGSEPGLLAYEGKRAVGWIALAPRSEYAGLARSRVAKPVDERAAWAVACFYVHPEHRGRGVASALVRAAIAHARKRGAPCLDAWPNEPKRSRRMVDVFAWMGVASLFERAGFREVARRTPTRPYLRAELERGPKVR